MNIQMAKLCGYSKVYFTFDCIGDTILLLSALEYLHKQTKRKLLIGTKYNELLVNCDYIDVLDNFCEDEFCIETYESLLAAGIVPVFISATEFVEENKKIRPVWARQHMFASICSKLGVDMQIKITPTMFLSRQEENYGRFFESSQIAIVSGGNQAYKTIPFDIVQAVVNDLKNQYNFVQVGCLSDPLLKGVLDKRSVGLRQTASILHNSDLFVGGIGGLMHIARAVCCRSVIAYSSAEPKHLVNYPCNINVFAPEPKCGLCGENKVFPYLTKCMNHYSCIKGICQSDIENAIETLIKKSNTPLETELFYVKPNPVTGIEDYIKRFGVIKESYDNCFNNYSSIQC